MDARNTGTALTPGWFDAMAVNRPAAERAVASVASRRAVKGVYQAAWLVNAVRCIDLTTLAGDDTTGRVQRLCAKARNPLGAALSEALEVEVTVGAVCVYPTMVAPAVRALEGSGIPVASVATGFPAGLTPLPLRLGNPLCRRSGGSGNRHCDHPRTGADRQLGSAL